MTYRLLVLDVDGTLLDSSHHLRDRVAQAVRAAPSAGLMVALATGKLFASVRPLLERLAIHGPQIVLNGAATQDSETQRPLRFCPLREEHRRAVIAAVREADPTVLISHFALDGIYMDEKHPDIGIFATYGEGPPRFVPDLLADRLPPAAKILLAGKPDRLAALRARITPLLAPYVSITTTTPDFLEFFDPAAGKGQALAALRELLGIPRVAVIAIGDGENDLPLLAEAGLAIAMANGAAATRQAADRIAPSNDEDGVAVVLEELLDRSSLR
ncbi:MAG TPA: Cof-type HAD-IIB family hydrolase [Ktedonobacterales bacterium]|nr:Cof-type HAD-IIB family hydrolase [Ktedonobacterales bacterium]